MTKRKPVEPTAFTMSYQHPPDYYATAMRHPVFWGECAYGLKWAAEILWRRYKRVHPPGVYSAPKNVDDRYLIEVWKLLMGLAMENLLKWVLIRRQSEAPNARPDQIKPRKTHCLNRLMADVKLRVDSDEKRLLEELQRHVEWEKYPVPLDKTGIVDHEFEVPKDVRTVQEIYKRIWALFVNEMQVDAKQQASQQLSS